MLNREKYLLKVLVIVAFVLVPFIAYAQYNPGVTVQGSVSANNCAKFVNGWTITDAGTTCGGSGGSPGGSTNDIQYKSGTSTFGGITLGTNSVLVGVGGGGLPVGSTNLSGLTLSSPTLSGTVAGANTIPLSILAQSGANTMLGNWSGVTANVTANAMPSCADTGGNHLNYVAGTGITCGTSSNGGTVTLGTSLSVANPQISGDATTGLYTAGAGLVDVTVSGAKKAEWSSTGEEITGTATVTSTSASALAVGANGATNPVLTVDASTASVATGIAIKGAATAGTTKITATDSGSNSSLDIEAKGTGTTTIAGTSTGAVTIGNASSGTTTIKGSGATAININQGNSNIIQIGNSGASVTITPISTATASVNRFKFAPLFGNNQTASTNVVVANFASTTMTHTAGALALQTDYVMSGYTDAFTSASTLTTGATLDVIAKSCGASGTCTNEAAIYLPSTALTGTITNSYGLLVQANTGATNNYAAAFTGGNVGIGTTAPNAGAALDLGSNTTSLLLPIGTTTQRPTAADGMLRYNTDTTSPEWYNGTVWMPAAGTISPAFTGTVTGVADTWTAAVTTTLTTAVTQGAAGYYLTFTDTSSLSAGQLVTGTSIPANTVIDYIGNGSSVKSTTASGAGSGYNVTVASATGIVVGMLITDTTSGARIGNNCVVNFISGTTITSNCSLASVLNADGLNFYPTVKLSAATTATVGAAASISFTNNAANTTVTGLNVGGNITMGGDIKVGTNRVFHSSVSTTNSDPSIVTPTISSVAFGIGSLAAATAEGGNVAIGPYALNAMAGQQGFYEENSFALLGNGSFNTAVGLGAMMNANTTGATASSGAGSFNTVVGAFSGLSITTGNRNTIVGEAAGQNLTTGNFNVMVGSELQNFGGSGGSSDKNVLIGADAAQSYSGTSSVVIGYNAGENISTSSYNSFVGFDSGLYMIGASSSDYNTCFGAFSCSGSSTPANDTGVNNTAMGAGALFGVTSGSKNTVLGFSVGQTTTTGSNNILIGVDTNLNASSAGASNEIAIGGTGGAWLRVTGSNTVSTAAATMGGTLTLTNLTTGTDTAVVCATSGNQLIKRAATSCVTSKRALKENIVSIEGEKAVHDIMALKPVKFKFKETKPAQSDPNFLHTQYGFIAEDVADTDKNMSTFEDDMVTPHGYRTESIVAMLVRTVQLQQSELQNLKAMKSNDNGCNGLNWLGQRLFCK